MKTPINISPPKTFSQVQERIGKLKGFDPLKLISNEAEEKLFDDFAITLSLIMNDAKTIEVFTSICGNSRPPGEVKADKKWGEYACVNLFLTRASVSLIHELFKKLNEKPPKNGALSPESYIFHKVCKTALYDQCIQSMSGRGRENWLNLVAIANGKHNASGLSDVLKKIRNKSFSHYDFKSVPEGYSYFFSRRDNKFNTNAFLSVGKDVWSLRFFYADAAAQGQIQKFFEPGDLKSFEDVRQDILNYVIFGIYAFTMTYLRQIKKLNVKSQFQ